MNQRLIAVFGSTGTGKSQLAIDLAKKCHSLGVKAEIINFDVMQMYSGMPVVTNKPTLEEMDNVPHHFLGHINNNLDDMTRIDKFQVEFRNKIHELNAHHILPIAVGGSHHYLQHALFPNNLASHLPRKESFSPELQEAIDTLPSKYQPLIDALPNIGPVSSCTHFPDNFDTSLLPEDFRSPDAYAKGLYEILHHLDPESATRWHWANVRKTRRAVDLVIFQKRTMKEVQLEQQDLAQDCPFNVLAFWVYCAEHVLSQRLDHRVDVMIKNGFVQELWDNYPNILSNGVNLDQGINQAIGVKEFAPLFSLWYERGIDIDNYLEELSQGNHPEETQNAIDAVKRGNRQYAKRQRKWITQQLLPKMKASEHIAAYILDGSDLVTWKSDVSQEAQKILRDWVQHDWDISTLPNGYEMNAIANEYLNPIHTKLSSNDSSLITCDMCTRNKTEPFLVKSSEWKSHLQTQRHRKAKEHQKREAQRQQYFLNKGGI